MTRVLVSGASGFIGKACVESLLANRMAVVAMSRRAIQWPAGVKPLRADLITGDGLSAQALEGVDVIVHCAGEIRDRQRMRALHVGGTQRLLAAADAARRPIAWVQLSSVGAYGPPDYAGQPRTIDETSLERPVGEYEITKTEADDLVRRAAAERRVAALTILRPANVVGAGMPSAALRGIFSAIRKGVFFHIGPGDALANFVHVHDVARAIVACVTHPAAAGETFNISSDCRWTEIAAHAASALAVTPPTRRLPESLVRLIVSTVGRVVPLPLTRERIDALVSRTSYPSAKIEARLGFVFERAMPGAIAALAGELA